MPKRLSGTKILAIMKVEGITQTELIRRSTLSPSTVEKVVHNRATRYSDYTAQCIADALGRTVMDIVDDEYVAPIISSAVSSSFETAIAGAVAEALTVVVDDVSPRTPSESVAQTVPDMTVHLPPALDVSQYVKTIQEEHQRTVEELKAAHQEHINDIRREKNAWRMVALSACALIAIGMLFLLFFQ